MWTILCAVDRGGVTQLNLIRSFSSITVTVRWRELAVLHRREEHGPCFDIVLPGWL